MRKCVRRCFLKAAAALLATPCVARAQPAQRVYRVGFLAALGPADDSDIIPTELRKLGFEEGRNVVFVRRHAERRPERVPGLAAELVASKVDVIVTDLPRQTLAARRATTTIPIVMTYGMVPQELGLIESLSHPGGNVAGTLIQGPDGVEKLVQIASEVLRRGARVANLYEPDYPGLEYYVRQNERVAPSVGMTVARFPVRTDEDVDAALSRARLERVDAMLVAPTGAIARRADRILKFSLSERIPILSPTNWLVPEGALLGFEPDLKLVLVRAAAIVARILKGANPADVPVELPTRYLLWINLRTADVLGVKIPPSVRIRADKVFE